MSQSSTNLSRLTVCPVWLRSVSGTVAVGIAMVAGTIKAAELFQLVDSRITRVGMPLLVLVAAGLALAHSIPLVRRSHPDFQRRWAWSCFAGAIIFVGLSALSNLAVRIFAGRAVPAVGHVEAALSLGAIALTIAGVYFLPSARLRARQLIAVVLDLTTLAIGVLLGFWIYALHPLVTTGPFAWPEFAVVAGLTLESVLLLCLLLMLMFKQQDPQTRRGVPPLITAGALAVVAEIGPYAHQLAIDASGTAPEYLGWAWFLAFLAVAARLMRNPPDVAAAPGRDETNFTIPIASAGLIGSLLFTTLVSRELWQIHVATLLPAMFLAIVLIVVRQTIIARENLRMALAMQKAKEVAEGANNARLHFLANISHDLRTPLNGVLGCAQILLRDRTITPKQKDLLKTMLGCAEHLRNLINDLLDLSKLEADKLELAPSPCDVRSFFDALNKTFSLEAENKNIALTLDADDSVPTWVMADRKRLQQILGNLVHNAIKFTERGGVHLRVRALDGQLRCEVRDTGCGILPDKIHELFQPFHVVDERSLKLEGTGLGLSIAMKLARKMGGDITVESIIGKGSTFTLAIPYVETAPVVDVQRTVVDYQGRRRRILIVDDQPANRVVLRTMLEPLDFLIDEAGNAYQALKQIDFARPDVILLDLMMPGVDGFELCEHIARLDLNPAIPCIAISAMSGVEVTERCTRAGFRELLNKPVSLEALLEALGTHAAIEWTYGVLQPPPEPDKAANVAEEIKVPPPEELAAFVDLGRRGFTRSLESRAEELARQDTGYVGFARRVTRYTKDFKIKELQEWLSSLSPEPAHGPKS